jgi:hypothetical protein
VMMQVVPQDVASSITIESITPEDERHVDVAESALSTERSPHSSLSSIEAELHTDTRGFKLLRNDLFCSRAEASNSCEQQTPQHRLLWKENPEYSGQASGTSLGKPGHFTMCICLKNSPCSAHAQCPCCCAGSLEMCPQAGSEACTIASHTATVPCLDTEPSEQVSMPCSAGERGQEHHGTRQAHNIEEESTGLDGGSLEQEAYLCEK